jgi:hypothetical protein
VLREREGTDFFFLFTFYVGDRMIFAKNSAKKIQSPEVGGKIQSVPGLIFFGDRHLRVGIAAARRNVTIE